jgi:hypothetical protein
MTQRTTAALLVTAVLAMIAAATVVGLSGIALNPAEPGATVAAIQADKALHLTELALDVLGWLALTAAALTLRSPLPAGLLACAGLAGLLHDAGNLAVTTVTDPEVAAAVLLTAKWTVNLAGLLWVAATAAAARHLDLPPILRRAGLAVTLPGLAAVALPWTGSMELEQLGYALHLPVLLWYCALAGHLYRLTSPSAPSERRTRAPA